MGQTSSYEQLKRSPDHLFTGSNGRAPIPTPVGHPQQLVGPADFDMRTSSAVGATHETNANKENFVMAIPHTCTCQPQVHTALLSSNMGRRTIRAPEEIDLVLCRPTDPVLVLTQAHNYELGRQTTPHWATGQIILVSRCFIRLFI